jgi:hypothetical protein
VTRTIPKALPGLFERERTLLKILPRCAHRAVDAMLREVVARRDVRVTTPRSRSCARLMRRIFEDDPLLCPQCQVETQIVSVIQEVTVVERLLTRMR